MTDFTFKDKYDISDFRRIMEILRAPGGCPWDAEQTHESIRRNVIEEAYELAYAIDTGDKENLREELGDLMMQVIFHARIEEEEGSFDLDDVADAACKKLVFRHPHVFGDIHCENSEEVLKTWDEVKRLEKSQNTVTSTMEGVAENLPALWRAEKIQKKASVTGFQWPDTSYAFNKIAEETEELRAAVEENDADNIEAELGDLLFAAVSLARLTETDPEKALHRACEKAIRRFRYMEEIAMDKGEAMEEMGLQKMLEIYQFAKDKEKHIFLDK